MCSGVCAHQGIRMSRCARGCTCAPGQTAWHMVRTQGFITMRPLPVCVPMTEQARGPPGHVHGVRLCCGVCVSRSVRVATCAPTGCLHFPPRVCGYGRGRPEASPRCSSRCVCGSVRSPVSRVCVCGSGCVSHAMRARDLGDQCSGILCVLLYSERVFASSRGLRPSPGSAPKTCPKRARVCVLWGERVPNARGVPVPV